MAVKSRRSSIGIRALVAILAYVAAVSVAAWGRAAFVSPPSGASRVPVASLVEGNKVYTGSDVSLGGVQSLIQASASPALLLTAVVSLSVVAAGGRPAVADALDDTSLLDAVLPPEEQQGYVQNALGYVNLWINFMLGFFGSLFGPLARELVKPGPVKYLVITGVVVLVTFLYVTVRLMVGLPIFGDPVVE